MRHLTIEQEFQTALEHHQAGRLDEAHEIYHHILAQQPRHADARRFLGVLAAQEGRLDFALGLIRQAIAINPDAAEYHNNLGNVLKAKGDWPEAAAAYLQAIRLKPRYPSAWNNLGNVLTKQKKFADAIDAYRRAIRFKPRYSAAHYNLGIALRETGRLDEAIAAYRLALELKPGTAEAYNNLGNALKQKNALDEAIEAYGKAIALRPDYPEAFNNLAGALNDKGQLDEAIKACQQALALKPNYAVAHKNLGNALKGKGRIDEAQIAYEAAVRYKLDLAEAHWNLALIYLARGDFERGWSEYEWRWRWDEFPSRRRNFPQPMWDGGDLAGRTLLLHAEQGLGDTLQFIRYATLAARCGGRIIALVPPELSRLVRGIAGIAQVVTDAPPHFDVQCPLLSLPLAFGTRLQTIPAEVPYIQPDLALLADWAEKVDPFLGKLNVGLVWAGRANHKCDRQRSMLLSQLSQLARIPDITFYSVQKGEGATQAANPPLGMKLIDLTSGLHDFADTAAFVAQLDLIITVDTAVAHLAGAMGKPVWVMLPEESDWRWLNNRDDSPWYPTLRLFRQTTGNGWNDVVARVAAALCEYAEAIPGHCGRPFVS